MLLKPKPLSTKERKALKEKKLTQSFGDTIQIESEEIIKETEEVDFDINDLAEIEVDNQIYDEAFREFTIQHETPLNTSSTKQKKLKNKSIITESRVENNNTSLRRSNRQRRPNIIYTDA